jgi:glucose-6-phosphate 1-epimerase
MSSGAVFNGAKAIRGGVPVVFPQFGQPNKALPSHGFARTSEWRLQECEDSSSSDEACAVFTLSDTEDTLKVWPHSFQLRYTIDAAVASPQCS